MAQQPLLCHYWKYSPRAHSKYKQMIIVFCPMQWIKSVSGQKKIWQKLLTRIFSLCHALCLTYFAANLRTGVFFFWIWNVYYALVCIIVEIVEISIWWQSCLSKISLHLVFLIQWPADLFKIFWHIFSWNLMANSQLKSGGRFLVEIHWELLETVLYWRRLRSPQTTILPT